MLDDGSIAVGRVAWLFRDRHPWATSTASTRRAPSSTSRSSPRSTVALMALCIVHVGSRRCSSWASAQSSEAPAHLTCRREHGRHPPPSASRLRPGDWSPRPNPPDDPRPVEALVMRVRTSRRPEPKRGLVRRGGTLDGIPLPRDGSGRRCRPSPPVPAASCRSWWRDTADRAWSSGPSWSSPASSHRADRRACDEAARESGRWCPPRGGRGLGHVDRGSRRVVRSPNDDDLQRHDVRLASSRSIQQVERVAAWRELARWLAHELKNPLFPLRITLENLQRARDAPEPIQGGLRREHDDACERPRQPHHAWSGGSATSRGCRGRRSSRRISTRWSVGPALRGSAHRRRPPADRHATGFG